MKAFTWLWKILLPAWLVIAGVVHAGTVTYVYTDPQGTPLAEADAQGNIIARFDYSPYGSIALGTAPNGPGYTGHVNDPETGLVYMQARYYDPSTGRFLSVDPIGPSPGSLFHLNRYDYANNNPINHTDPDGRCPDTDFGCGAMAQSAGLHPDQMKLAAPFAVAAAAEELGAAAVVRMVARFIVRQAAKGTVTARTQRPKGVPKSWVADKPKSGPGTIYRNPENPQHDTVRAVPGRPESSQPGQQVDHVVRTANGQRYGEANTPVSTKSQESHIPAKKFHFVPANELPKN